LGTTYTLKPTSWDKKLENFSIIATEYGFLLKMIAAAVVVVIAGYFLRKRPEPTS
jgi:hypothetical protein